MNKRDLYKKYVETFGINSTLLDVVIDIGNLGIAICMKYLTHTTPQSPPLKFDEEFLYAFANAHIALEQIIEMMGEGEKEIFLRKKHYLLNQMESDISKKENETVRQQKED